jgi:hypothetical protein
MAARKRMTKRVKGRDNDGTASRRYQPGNGPGGPQGKGRCQKCGGNHMTKNCSKGKY